MNSKLPIIAPESIDHKGYDFLTKHLVSQPTNPKETPTTIFIHIVMLWMKPRCWLQVLKYQPNNVRPRKPFSTLQCFFDENLPSTLRNYHSGWFFLYSRVTWIIGATEWSLFSIPPTGMLRKSTRLLWDVLLGFGRVEWQRILKDLEKAPDVAYNDDLKSIFNGVMCWKPYCLQKKWSSGYLER